MIPALAAVAMFALAAGAIGAPDGTAWQDRALGGIGVFVIGGVMVGLLAVAV